VKYIEAERIIHTDSTAGPAIAPTGFLESTHRASLRHLLFPFKCNVNVSFWSFLLFFEGMQQNHVVIAHTKTTRAIRLNA
jgi:hypothetical protein